MPLGWHKCELFSRWGPEPACSPRQSMRWESGNLQGGLCIGALGPWTAEARATWARSAVPGAVRWRRRKLEDITFWESLAEPRISPIYLDQPGLLLIRCSAQIKLPFTQLFSVLNPAISRRGRSPAITADLSEYRSLTYWLHCLAHGLQCHWSISMRTTGRPTYRVTWGI